MHSFLVRHRFALQSSFDCTAWFIGLALATYLRYEFEWSNSWLVGLLQMTLVVSVLQVLIGRWRGLYIHRWRYGTFEEIVNTAITTSIVGVLGTLVNRFVLDHAIPVSASLMGGVVAFCVMGSGRVAFRYSLDHHLRPSDAEERVIVFGAGEGGTAVVRSMLTQRSSPYLPVALLDDDPDRRKLRLRNVPVMGGRADIAEVAHRTRATTMVIAIPSASGELVRELAASADEAGLRTLVLPPVSDLFGAPIGFDDIRPLTESDLLGRREIVTDLDSVAGYITGKRVLVTGAGGSIGSELCRMIHRFAPESLIMLDRDESALHAVQLSIEGRALLDSRELQVACIRDRKRLTEVFLEHRPQVVFHAAALKHLPLLEMHPSEGWKTNVWGTQHLLDVSGRFGVERFVNISTDKAADPSSILGLTKRLAERLTARAGLDHEGTYLSVRFGNVLGSRGSVLPLFRAQIEAGGPVTVTDPDVTRYFMTIEEACQLVVQAGALGQSGDVMVLDMGEQVRIADLARRLVAESGRRVEIVFTGLRPGEKLSEDLFGDDEVASPSAHSLIHRVPVPPVDFEDLRSLPRQVVDLRAAAGVEEPVESEGRLFSLGAD